MGNLFSKRLFTNVYCFMWIFFWCSHVSFVMKFLKAFYDIPDKYDIEYFNIH